ncbi:MAG: hydantoinase B/oxoprolinase family protein [Alphaproteobacteria bacterium]|nr:hydantoinase B/oxoprolinase family protein [Alphaproteobacteria bacterium]
MSEGFDPVLTEVLRHELVAISEEMNITMKQTTRSIVAKEGGDYSAGLLNQAGQVIAQAVPYGLGYFTAVMPHILRKFGGRFRPGDVIVSNDPYAGLSHLPDIAVVRPIFWHGALRGFAAVVQHHTDIGGRFPGGMGLPCAELYEEGLRLPAVRFYDNDQIDEAVWEIIASNVRAPDDVLGDLQAGVAACRRGEAGLIALLEKHGAERVTDCSRRLLAHSEQAMRKAFAAIADGHYQCEDVFDDGLGTRVALKVTLAVEGDGITVDFAGTGPQVGNALNVPPDMIGNFLANNVFMALLGSAEVPLNSGLFAPIRTLTPEGSVVNPRFPAAVGSRGQLLWRIADLVSSALAAAVPERMPAGSEGGVSMMIFTPSKPMGSAKSGGVMTELYASGWGGRPSMDGIDGVMPIVMAGFQTNSGEVFEQEMPVMLDGFGLVPDTGGAGQYRGALSVYRRWRFLADGRVMLRTCRVDSLPYGLGGGRPGTPFRAVLLREGKETLLPAQIMLDIAVKAGDVLTHVQPGAGGHGPPAARDPARVREDVLDGKLSAEHARREYGADA